MNDLVFYFNGEFVPESEARISTFDSAVSFGDMVFEMTRSFNGKPFRLEHHLKRLYASIRYMEIDPKMEMEEMLEVTLETVERNTPNMNGVDFGITHNVSRGPSPRFAFAFPKGIRPTISISCYPLAETVGEMAKFYKVGLHAVVPRQMSIPARFLDPKVKNRSRAFYQLANNQVHKVDPEAWALLSDDDGFITEGTGSNFLLVRDGVLLSPEPRNMLRGVSRDMAIDLAKKLGIEFKECNLEPYDVANADEAFFTTTPYCLIPATRFNGYPIGDGKVGPITEKLTEAWSSEVGVDILAQAQEYSKLGQALEV